MLLYYYLKQNAEGLKMIYFSLEKNDFNLSL